MKTTVILFLILICYSLIGTSNHVKEIKRRAPEQITANGYTILRYEGYEYGSWNYHGGKVWYHVAETSHPNIRYRMFVCLWDGELKFYYKTPEVISNVDVTIGK